MMAGPGATTINMHQNQPHQVSIHKHSINIQLEITNQMFDEEISEDNLELDNISEINNQYLENFGDFN